MDQICHPVSKVQRLSSKATRAQSGEESGQHRCPYCVEEGFSSGTALRKHITFRHTQASLGGVSAAVVRPETDGTNSNVGHSRWDAEFMLKMSEGRVVHHAPRDFVSGVKDQFRSTVAALHEQVVARMQPHLAAGIDAETMLEDIFQVCEDLTVRDSELNRLRKSPAYVEPQRRYLGKNPNTGEEFYAYDNPLDKVLEAMFATQPETFQDAKSFAALVMSGALRTDAAFDPDLFIQDTVDGCATGSFIKQLRFTTPGGLVLVFIFYYDGLEVVNGLGQARLTHELGAFYWALVPLQQGYRLNSSNLRVATLCYKRAISEVGMQTVIHGRKEEQYDPKCNAWGLWMKRLRAGHSLTTPLGKLPCCGGTVLLAADTPAAAECMGTKKAVGPATKSICRCCHCTQAAGQANSPHRSPNSFLAGLPGWKEHCKDRKQNFTLRTDADMQEFLTKGQAVLEGRMSRQALEDWQQSMGVNSFAGAMAGVGCPMDPMHIVYEGIGRQQIGALSYVVITKWGHSPFEIVKRLDEFAKSKGLPRSRLPYLNSSRLQHLGEGQAGGLPSSDCSFPGTCMQVAEVILHAQEIFAPLVGAEHKGDPVWQVRVAIG